MKAYDSAATSFNIRSSFRKAGLCIRTNRKPYAIKYNFFTLKKKTGFQIFWNLNIKKEEMSARKLNQKFYIINIDYLLKNCHIYINDIYETKEHEILE